MSKARKVGAVKRGYVRMGGVADAHGIESYFDASDKRALGIAQLRASLNRQRHAIAYIADVPKKADEEIQALLKKGKYAQALKSLKLYAAMGTVKNVGLAGGGNVQASWDLIPNPKLDPWR
jgi:hypothetical protein